MQMNELSDSKQRII